MSATNNQIRGLFQDDSKQLLSPNAVKEILRNRNKSTVRSTQRSIEGHHIPIDEMVGLKKNLFGIPNYVTVKNDLIFKKPPFGKCDRAKNVSFVEHIMNKK